MFLGIIFLRDLKKDANIYNGFQTSIFYFQQNFQIFLFFLIKKFPKNSLEDKNLDSFKQMIEDHNTWLSDNSNLHFIKILKLNNILVNNILSNIIG